MIIKQHKRIEIVRVEGVVNKSLKKGEINRKH